MIHKEEATCVFFLILMKINGSINGWYSLLDDLLVKASIYFELTLLDTALRS